MAWLNAHHTNGCAVCGGDNWGIIGLVALPLMEGNGLVETGFASASGFNFKTSTAVQVACDNCQHILLFSAQGIGIV